jgi:hypothetical protein
VDAKVSPENAREMLRLHADGVSYRELGRRFGISASLAHRHVARALAEPPEAQAGVVPLRRQYGETEFPSVVPGYEDEPTEPDEPRTLPDRAPGQPRRSVMHPKEWAEHRLRTVRMDIAHLHTLPPEQFGEKLAAAEERERELAHWIDEWRPIIDGLPFGRPSTRVKLSEWTVEHGQRPRAIYDNPYGP